MEVPYKLPLGLAIATRTLDLIADELGSPPGEADLRAEVKAAVVDIEALRGFVYTPGALDDPGTLGTLIASVLRHSRRLTKALG